jgi:hypothetical protein
MDEKVGRDSGAEKCRDYFTLEPKEITVTVMHNHKLCFSGFASGQFFCVCAPRANHLRWTSRNNLAEKRAGRDILGVYSVCMEQANDCKGRGDIILTRGDTLSDGTKIPWESYSLVSLSPILSARGASGRG